MDYCEHSFLRISALASDMKSNQNSKIRALYTTSWWIFLTLLHYFFDLTSFQRLRQKSLDKFRCYFGRNDVFIKSFRFLLTFRIYPYFPGILQPEPEFNLKLSVPIQPLSIQLQPWPLRMAIIQPIFLQHIYHMQGKFLGSRSYWQPHMPFYCCLCCLSMLSVILSLQCSVQRRNQWFPYLSELDFFPSLKYQVSKVKNPSQGS